MPAQIDGTKRPLDKNGVSVDPLFVRHVDANGNDVNTAAPGVLSATRISFSATGDQAIVGATAGQATSIYRLRLTVAGATNISVKDGSTVLEVIQFAAAGALVLHYSARPYWGTSANSAFVLASSAVVQVEGRVEFVKA